MKYIIQCRENGDVIDETDTREKAETLVIQWVEDDKTSEILEGNLDMNDDDYLEKLHELENFYEIVETE